MRPIEVVKHSQGVKQRHPVVGPAGPAGPAVGGPWQVGGFTLIRFFKFLFSPHLQSEGR